MTTLHSPLVLRDLLSPDLAFRNTAKSFFNYIASLPEESITIDFEGIRSITRSFAQEYIIRKKEMHACVQKNIIEINIPTNIDKMFCVVTSFSKKSPMLHSDRKRSISLTV